MFFETTNTTFEESALVNENKDAALDLYFLLVLSFFPRVCVSHWSFFSTVLRIPRCCVILFCAIFIVATFFFVFPVIV